MKLAAPAFPLDLVNRALARETSLRERLAAHAGAVFMLATGPLHARFVIQADGLLAFPVPETSVALTLKVSPTDVPALLHDPARFDVLVHADGDADLASTLKDLAQTLPWFVESAFASTFGSVAGNRLAQAGRVALGLPGHAADRLRSSVAGYVREEAEILVPKHAATALQDDAAALAARVEALDGRVQRLERSRKSRAPA